MKERLGLRRKFGAFTDEEIQAVKEYYEAHPDSIDLDELVSSIGRQKTSEIPNWEFKNSELEQSA